MASPNQTSIDSTTKPFHSLRIIIVVLLVTISIPFWTNWYTGEVTVPRYCDDPQGTLERLEKVLAEERPAGDGSRIPYIRAAKLLFLLPRQPDENIPDYLSRVQIHLKNTCR